MEVRTEFTILFTFVFNFISVKCRYLFAHSFIEFYSHFLRARTLCTHTVWRVQYRAMKTLYCCRNWVSTHTWPLLCFAAAASAATIAIIVQRLFEKCVVMRKIRNRNQISTSFMEFVDMLVAQLGVHTRGTKTCVGWRHVECRYWLEPHVCAVWIESKRKQSENPKWFEFDVTTHSLIAWVFNCELSEIYLKWLPNIFLVVRKQLNSSWWILMIGVGKFNGAFKLLSILTTAQIPRENHIQYTPVQCLHLNESKENWCNTVCVAIVYINEHFFLFALRKVIKAYYDLSLETKTAVNYKYI